MDLRRTPFYEQHVAAGARLVPFAGWEMPVQYTGVNAEHQQVRRSVGLFDVSHMGEVRVRGPKAADALSALVSNDVRAIEIGQAQYNALCNEAGGVVDDLVIYRLADEDWFVCVNAANRDKDFAWMTAHNPHPEAARMTDEGDLWAQIAIQGRNALAVVQALTDAPVEPLGNYRFTVGTFAGVHGCIIARTGYTGEDGFEVFIPATQAAPVWGKVMAAGAGFGIQPIGLGARDTLRLEVRYCLYGHELNDETSPLQAGLAWITKLDKEGGFIGREAILSRKGKEPRRLAGLLVDGSRIPREGMRVLHQGEEVGHVTSGTRSPSIERGIALAYVRPDLTRPGTRLVIDVRGKEAEADVVSGPFYKRDY